MAPGRSLGGSGEPLSAPRAPSPSPVPGRSRKKVDSLTRAATQELWRRELPNPNPNPSPSPSPGPDHRNSGDGSFKTGDALTDVIMTLALMVGLRLAEEEGLL